MDELLTKDHAVIDDILDKEYQGRIKKLRWFFMNTTAIREVRTYAVREKRDAR